MRFWSEEVSLALHLKYLSWRMKEWREGEREREREAPWNSLNLNAVVISLATHCWWLLFHWVNVMLSGEVITLAAYCYRHI